MDPLRRPLPWMMDIYGRQAALGMIQYGTAYDDTSPGLPGSARNLCRNCPSTVSSASKPPPPPPPPPKKLKSHSPAI